MGKIVIYRPGIQTPEIIETSKPPSLEQMQKWVGGYVEIIARVYINDEEHQVFDNEDGLAIGATPNAPATKWLREHGVILNMATGYIMGNMVILTGKNALWD